VNTSALLIINLPGRAFGFPTLNDGSQKAPSKVRRNEG
jgi:hypothetical protein